MGDIVPFPEDRARAWKLAHYPDLQVILRNTDDPPSIPDLLIYVREEELETPAYEGQRVWFWVCADCNIMTMPDEDFEGKVRQANEHWQQVHDGKP
jgi:hypothetical protein